MSCYPVLFFEREVTAVVLCGGLSTRMGADKGLMKNDDGVLWVQKMVHICQELALPTVISINGSQQLSYEAIFAKEDLIIDIYPTMGPMGGILSVHNQLIDNDLLVLSCDMQDLDSELVFEVLQHHEKLAEYDAVIPFQDGFYQPFPGLYAAELLRKVSILHHTQQLENNGLQNMFKTFWAYELHLPQVHGHKLKSYNSKADLGDEPIR